MKKILLSSLLLSTLLLSACNKLWEWPFSDKETEVSVQEGSTDSSYYSYTAPYDAMSTLNRYTDLFNAVQTEASYLDDSIGYFESGIEDYKDYEIEPYFDCYFELYDRDALYNDTMNPVGLTQEETENIKPQAERIFYMVDETEALCNELTKYVIAQDYKDDDFMLGLDLAGQINGYIEALYSTSGELGDDLDALSAIYDTWTVDFTDPISVGRDNMSKDLDQAKLIYDLVEEAYVSDVTEGKAEELQALYDLLTDAASEHLAATPDAESYVTYNYDDFYDVMDQNFLPTVKRTLRSLEAGDLDALASDYSDLLDYYNLLISDYNYYLDASGY